MFHPLRQLFVRSTRGDRHPRARRRSQRSLKSSSVPRMMPSVFLSRLFQTPPSSRSRSKQRARIHLRLLAENLEPRALLAAGSAAQQLSSGAALVMPTVTSQPAVIATASTGAKASAASAATVPTAPLDVQAKAGNASVAIQWSTPGWDGGSPITDYRIQYSTNNGTTWTVFPDGTSTNIQATVTGLLNGITYIFRVTACNAAGFGSPATTPPVTTGTVPAAPPSLGVAVCSRPTASTTPTDPYWVEISWTAPPVVRGAEVAGYTVQQSSDNGRMWTTVATTTASTTAVRLDSLSGEACVFRVAATNRFGLSSFCQTSAPVAPGNQLLAIPGNGQVSLAWTRSYNGTSVQGITLRGFVIEYKVASATVTTWTRFPGGPTGTWQELSPTATSAVVTGLRNDVQYVFRVTGVLSNGVTLSMPSMFPATTPNASGFTQPAMPQMASTVPGNRQVTLSWPPVAPGGTPVTEYLVSYMKLTNDWRTMRWTTIRVGASRGPVVVSDLDNGSQYVFKVAAVNAVGTGLFSPVSAAVTPGTTPFRSTR